MLRGAEPKVYVWICQLMGNPPGNTPIPFPNSPILSKFLEYKLLA